MRRWKRVLLLLCVLLAAAAALILWGNRGRSKLSVSISFLGYTNRTVGPGKISAAYIYDSSNAFTAFLCLSNTGTVSAKLLHLNTFASGPLGWLQPGYHNGADLNSVCGGEILKPGEFFTFEAFVPTQFIDFSAGADLVQPGFLERIDHWAEANSTWQARLSRVFPKPKYASIIFGPITNKPPASVGH